MLRASRQKKTRHVAVPGKSEGASTPSCIALKEPSSSAARYRQEDGTDAVTRARFEQEQQLLACSCTRAEELSANEARTATASRDGTAFFAVAPRKRPASAHSPRTGLTRKVKICSPSSRDRVSSWLLGLVAVLRAHRQALFHEPSACLQIAGSFVPCLGKLQKRLALVLRSRPRCGTKTFVHVLTVFDGASHCQPP